MLWALAPLFLVVWLIDLIWLGNVRLVVDFQGFKFSVLISSGIYILGVALWIHPFTSKLGKTFFFLATMFLFPFPLVLLSELILTTGRALIDPLLATADRLLGFDWLAYRAMILAHPLLAEVLSRCYNSLAIQMTALILILGLGGHFQTLNRLIITLVACSVVVAICGGLFPAVGAYEYYLQDDPTGIGGFFHSVRDGHAKLADIAAYKGTVSFPSYHTVLAIAFARAAWVNRYLRWPFLALNTVMILGIPLNGAHYLVDVIGGATVVLLVDYLVVQILQAKRRPRAYLSAQLPALDASQAQ